MTRKTAASTNAKGGGTNKILEGGATTATNATPTSLDTHTESSKRIRLAQKVAALEARQSRRQRRAMGLFVLAVLIAGHRVLVSTLHENTLFFSMLNAEEREMTLRSEQAMYYGYYKRALTTMQSERGYFDGLIAAISSLTHDTTTEYPRTINALHRFNIWPEVVMAGCYDARRRFLSWTGTPQDRSCGNVNRQGPTPTTLVCNGMDVPIVFYTQGVFYLQGVLGAGFFAIGWYLAHGSFLGGALTTAAFLTNYDSVTRTQWAVPLRESFAHPFLVLQLLGCLHCLRTPALPSLRQMGWLALATFAFTLPWQFAPFALLTQTGSLFAAHLLGYVSQARLLRLQCAQAVGVLGAAAAQFGNTFPLTSAWGAASVAIAVTTVVTGPMFLEFARTTEGGGWVWRAGMVVNTALAYLALSRTLVWLANRNDSSHIAAILRTKFDPDFHE